VIWLWAVFVIWAMFTLYRFGGLILRQEELGKRINALETRVYHEEENEDL